MSEPTEELIAAAEADADGRHEILTALIARRKRKGLTIEQAAARMGCAWTHLAQIEQGGRDPYLSTLQRYARALGGRLVTDIEMPEEQS